jgi:hypothetical protein
MKKFSFLYKRPNILRVVLILSIVSGGFNLFSHPSPVFAASANDGFLPQLNEAVHVVAVADDGKIWIGGEFTQIDSVNQARLARLHPDGRLDTSFSLWTNDIVRAIIFEPDGSVLVGGDFTHVSNIPRNHLFRIKPDGSLDPDFDPSPDSYVYTLGLQSNGDIIVGGQFSSIAGGN